MDLGGFLTQGGYLLSQFSLVQYLEFFARILVACACGAAIGFERSKRFKEAGIRTHIIINQSVRVIAPSGSDGCGGKYV